MALAGIILIIIALLLISIRARLAIFGETATGTIIGYGSSVRGTKGAVSYNYKVKYEYNGKEYIAQALESTAVFTNNAPTKNLHREVTVRFDPKKPKIVSIKEFSEITVIGFFMLALGIAVILIN